jgi:nucleoid DNA-binding protein
MNTSQLVAAISTKTGFSQGSCEKMVKAMCEAIVETMKQPEGRVAISRFGIFERRLMKARTVSSPMFKGPVQVPEQTVIRFKMGAAVKEQMNPA